MELIWGSTLPKGTRFGKLTVDFDYPNISSRQMVSCTCDCGNTKLVKSFDLKRNHTVSCGCLKRSTIKYVRYIDGRTTENSRLVGIWNKARRRCLNPKDGHFAEYGGRGIKMCEEWSNRDTGYQAFKKWSYENGYADCFEIDRIDVNGNYEPSNCRWISHKENMDNTRHTRHFEYKGEILTINQIAQKYGLDAQQIRERVNRGWNIVEAVELPKNAKRQSHKEKIFVKYVRAV